MLPVLSDEMGNRYFVLACRRYRYWVEDDAFLKPYNTLLNDHTSADLLTIVDKEKDSKFLLLDSVAAKARTASSSRNSPCSAAPFRT